jgi:hypothetical protein
MESRSFCADSCKRFIDAVYSGDVVATEPLWVDPAAALVVVLPEFEPVDVLIPGRSELLELDTLALLFPALEPEEESVL